MIFQHLSLYYPCLMRFKYAALGYSKRLNGWVNEKFGLARYISVMPGDTVRLEVFGKYLDPNSGNWTTALTSLVNQIAAGSGGSVIDGAAYSNSTTSFPFAGLLSTSNSTGGPKAYLNWLVFDRNYVFIPGKSGYQRMTTAAKEAGTDVPHEKLSSPDIIIGEPGYMYVYLSNEETTAVEVYFDDFKVTQIKSPVMQTDDYYPFGLTFSSYQRENSITNQYKYNGIERQDELELGWDLAQYRAYEPTLGRFMQIDPIMKEHESPYAWNTNNPIIYADPTCADSTQRANAMQEANRYVEQNPDPGGDGGYGFAGYHAGEPGSPIDCSGMVSQSANASGFGYLNNGNSTGVQNIVNQPLTQEININDLQSGNIVVFPGQSHVAFISNPVRDNDGNVTGYTLVHSEFSQGPNKDVNDRNNYYVKNYLGEGGSNVKYYSWDGPDLPKMNQGSSSTFIGPAPSPSITDRMRSTGAPLLRDVANIIDHLLK